MTVAEAEIRDVPLAFRGTLAMVTGGASGIGAAIVDAFAARGAEVAVVDIKDDSVAGGRKDKRGAQRRAFKCDVADPDNVDRVVEEVFMTWGRIDVLVNSAGIALLEPAESLSLSAWQSTLAVNLTGSFLMAQSVGRHMLAARRGRIINIASQAARVALRDHAAYCASKAGLLGLTRVLAAEWGKSGITVNAISPTVVLTDLGRKAWEGAKGDALRALIPTGRFAEPGEIAAVALFLASDEAAMINGADIVVDGGYTIQ